MTATLKIEDIKEKKSIELKAKIEGE